MAETRVHIDRLVIGIVTVVIVAGLAILSTGSVAFAAEAPASIVASPDNNGWQ